MGSVFVSPAAIRFATQVRPRTPRWTCVMAIGFQTIAGRVGEARRHVREATARERRCVGDRRSRRRYHPGLRWDR